MVVLLNEVALSRHVVKLRLVHHLHPLSYKEIDFSFKGASLARGDGEQCL